MPYLAPFAVCPSISKDPRFADMKAIPVIQWERERFANKKSSELLILRLRTYPIPKTTTKYAQMIPNIESSNL